MSIRRTRPTVLAALALAGAALAGVLGYQSVAAPSSSASAPDLQAATAGHHGPPGFADGVVPDGVTVLDERFPAVTRLDPGLRAALRSAAEDAAQDGLVLEVNSGWRSAAYQALLLREAVAEYGSEAEAARWVATPERSAHVSGDAVDIGPAGAADWLGEHGAAYGLCRTYRNEPWHFELRPDAAADGCPAPYADPTEDPRMQR